MHTKKLGWKENHEIPKNSTEDSTVNIIVDKRQVLKILENYTTEFYDQPNQPENLETEPDEEVDADKKGPYILQNEVEKAIKEMGDKKATGDDVSGGVLKLLGEDGFRIMTEVISNIYETGQWPKDLTAVTKITTEKKPKATKCTDDC
jgi:hypothetical protein